MFIWYTLNIFQVHFCKAQMILTLCNKIIGSLCKLVLFNNNGPSCQSLSILTTHNYYEQRNLLSSNNSKILLTFRQTLHESLLRHSNYILHRAYAIHLYRTVRKEDTFARPISIRGIASKHRCQDKRD